MRHGPRIFPVRMAKRYDTPQSGREFVIGFLVSSRVMARSRWNRAPKRMTASEQLRTTALAVSCRALH